MEKKDCDILVLGAGGSGMVAGVRAADGSGKKVMILEKASYVGGGMLLASTMRTFRSRWQQERGIPDQSNAFIRQMMDLTYWRLDPVLVKNAVLGTGQFFDWYSQMETPENMAKFQPRPYVFDIPVHGQVGPQVDAFHKGSGAMFMHAMEKRAKELGVEIQLNTQVKEILTEEGAFAGVTAEQGGQLEEIRCKTLIIACGSWIRNKEIVKKVLPEYLDMDVEKNAHQNKAYTGDAIAIGEKLGAYIDWDNMCFRLMGPICSYGDHSKFDLFTNMNEAILVDLNAKRFVAEPMAPRMDPFDTGHVLLHHPKGKAFYLFSKNILERVIRETAGNGKGEDTNPFGLPAFPPYEEIEALFAAEKEKGSRIVAMEDTVQALAERIGLDAAQLEKTISSYNHSCKEGEDWDYFKEPSYMEPLSEGPFFAVEGKLSTDGAFGGLLVDPQMRVYAKDKKSVLKGVYATGDICSGRFISLGGVKKQVLNDMSWALSSGFLAGTSAAQD